MALSSSTSHEPAAAGEVDDAALERLRRFGGDKLVRELVLLFAEHAPARVAAARQATAEGDVSGVRRSLHTLKSSAAQLGADGVQRAAQDGEALAASGHLTALGPLLATIEAELALVVARLLAAARLP